MRFSTGFVAFLFVLSLAGSFHGSEAKQRRASNQPRSRILQILMSMPHENTPTPSSPSNPTVQAVVQLEYTIRVDLLGLSIFDIPANDMLNNFSKALTEATQSLLENNDSCVSLKRVGGLLVVPENPGLTGQRRKLALDGTTPETARNDQQRALRKSKQVQISRPLPKNPKRQRAKTQFNEIVDNNRHKIMSRRIFKEARAPRRLETALPLEFSLVVKKVDCFLSDCSNMAIHEQPKYEAVFYQDEAWSRRIWSRSEAGSISILRQATIRKGSVDVSEARTIFHEDDDAITIDDDGLMREAASTMTDTGTQPSSAPEKSILVAIAILICLF